MLQGVSVGVGDVLPADPFVDDGGVQPQGRLLEKQLVQEDLRGDVVRQAAQLEQGRAGQMDIAGCLCELGPL